MGSFDLDQMILQWFYQSGGQKPITVVRAFGIAHGNLVILKIQIFYSLMDTLHQAHAAAVK
jgi:hypothetical protein